MDETDTRPEASARLGRYSINAVTSAIAILDAVVEHGSTTLEGAAAAAGVSRSTAYRLLVTLQDLGLLQRAPGGGYGPGPSAFRWAGRLLEQLDLRTIARPTLHRLRDESGESANLALLRGGELLYVDVLESPGTLRTVEAPGSPAPLHAAAIGKAVAAHLEPEELTLLLGEEAFPVYTPATITDRASLDAELEKIRREGYSLDVEAVEFGVACVAAPIFVNGRVAGAISLSGPRTRMSTRRLRELASAVREAAFGINREAQSSLQL
jgi:IclR family acetate operon transcriptional repressor